MIIATCDKYELIKDERGVYFFCRNKLWCSCGYIKDDETAISEFKTWLQKQNCNPDGIMLY